MDSETSYDGTLITEIQNKSILHWNYRKLKIMPLELLSFGSAVKEIYYKENSLEMLPESLSENCPKLTNLNLYKNDLVQLPSSIGDLKCLTSLDLSRNRLSQVPESIGDLWSLKMLDLNHNKIQNLPHSIGNLISLEYLLLNGNQIQSLPKSLSACKNLINLHVSNNQLMALPENLHHCTELMEIYVNGNNISALPKTLKLCSKLAFLNVNENDLRDLAYIPENVKTKVLFHHNPKLHHIQNKIANQLSEAWLKNLPPPLTFPTTGCFVPIQEDIKTYWPKVIKDDKKYVFQFTTPVSILPESSTPSLLEFALRKIKTSNSNHLCVPKELIKLLNNKFGACDSCGTHLVTEIYLGIHSVPIGAFDDNLQRQTGFISYVFCTPTCKKSYGEYKNIFFEKSF